MLHVEMLTLVFLVLWMCVFGQDLSSKTVADRYAVYWNSTNPRFPMEKGSSYCSVKGNSSVIVMPLQCKGNLVVSGF